MTGPTATERAEPDCLQLAEPEVGRWLSTPRLSPTFDAFLAVFAREAIRSGGSAWAAVEKGACTGLLLVDPSERTASLFSKDPAAIAALLVRAGELAVFSEIPLPLPSERYDVLAVDLAGEPPHRFVHAARTLGPQDVGAAARLLDEVYGGSSERWLRIALGEGERLLGVELSSELAGVACVLVAGVQARLHLLTVRPGARGLGIGRDLLAARLWLAWRAGARRAITEIAERNRPSRSIAEAAGMRSVGRFDLYARRPAAPGTAEPPTSASPRRTGTSAPSSR